jgi:15-cis-phytoene synthase
LEAITQIELANYEKVSPPRLEKSNFAYSFSLLPHDQRNAINSVYAFCSYIDDIVDCTSNASNSLSMSDFLSLNNESIVLKKLDRLLWWEREIEQLYSGNISNPLITPFIAMIERFAIPKQYFLTLIDGCRRDLFQKRYKTFEELKDYCYSVASVPGLMSIEIFGYRYEETRNYAINLGYALQLTNILRDIKADKDRGYIYIPQEDLDRFGYTEDDIMNEVYNDKFIELMHFETQRIRQLYHKARTYLHPDEKVTIISAEIMDAIYYRLLEKIELNEFNVFRKKITVSPVHKLLITLKHWLSLKMFIKRIKKQL